MSAREIQAAQPHIVRPPGVEGVELHTGRTPAGQGPRTFYDQYVLLVAQGTEARIRYRGRTQSVPERVLVLVAPGEVISVSAPRDYTYHSAFVAPDVATGITEGSEAATFAEVFRRLYMREESLVRAFLRTHAELERAASPLEAETALLELWTTLRKPAAGAPAAPAAQTRTPSPVIRRARDFIHTHFVRGVTLEELSHLTGMCRYSLVRAFTREVGVPPHAFQTTLRVHRARELIGAGMPIAQVALEVGFADQSHLNRHFKHVLGFTPGHYARETRQWKRAA